MAKGAGSNDTRADLAVKLVLFFFVSILSFSIGTYLGKQVSDADHKQAALETEYTGEKVAENKETYEDEAVAPIEDEVVAKITDEAIAANRKVASVAAHEEHEKATHEEATAEHESPAHGKTPAEAEGYTRRDKKSATAREDYTMKEPTHAEPEHGTAHAPEHAPAPTRATATAATKTTETPAAHKIQETMEDAGNRVASGMAPSADPKKVVTPTATLPTVATSAAGKYTVQVASYATTQEAEDYANKLKDKGYPAFVVPAEIGGKTWYRVSLGKFADQNSAKSYLSELIATQTVKSALVQKLIQ